MLVIQRPTVEPVGDEEANRQRFAISPLEPGFGHTIGNSLRRVLLSAIPGAAVTQVRFDEALHEFDTIGGVVEDVTDIILNLKDLVVVSHSEEPVSLRLDARGPASVTAADIQVTSDVEILNPDLQIATMNGDGRLAIDITIAQGRGYVSADRNKTSDTIGVIPVDSIFSPVRKATFSVEPTRVEQDTNFDRLVVDIQTDGSISPSDALASAGDTLRSLVGLIADMSEQPQGLELGEVAVAGTGPSDLDQPIEDLDLSERPRNCLKRAQVNSIGELVNKTEDDLLAITNFDKLIIDVQTDGSITPAEALASAGDTLRSLVGLVADMSEEPQGLELGEVPQVGTGPSDLDLPIEDLELSERPRNCLKRAQVNSIGELVNKTEDDLLAITNFGQKSLDEVVEKLDERGLTLRVRG